MKVIIDSNVWISFLLGFQKELMHDVLMNEHIEVYVCSQLMHEIQDVVTRPKIQNRVNEADTEMLFRIIKMYCANTEIKQCATTHVRDEKDVYLLSLSQTIKADYIITGDNDLVVIEEYKGTKIVTPAQFRSIL